MLTMITERAAVADAHKRLVARLRKGATKHVLPIGYQSGSEEVNAYWRGTERYWFIDEPNRVENRTWLAFGTTAPGSISQNHSIICEINFPKIGLNRQVAGAFARDSAGALFITHTGRINVTGGGGGKSAFLRWSPYEPVNLFCPLDKRATEVIVISPLNSADLATNIGRFIRDVRTYKELARSGQVQSISNGQFRPEFEGKRTPHTLEKQIEAICRHGAIVNDLRAQLRDRGFNPRNDSRDLYLNDSKGRCVALIEAKSDCTTSSIYSAIGQLMYYSASRSEKPLLVLVSPRLTSRTIETLDRIGVNVVQYTWRDGRPEFSKLDELTSKLRELGAK